ncbi:PstS family phosphate ABC transporter substrate-binding protein [Marinicellulosiphila megalodicopiae]|uniref:PstS family phosphate ABC transporter substrate-binding protein n=1 Tax=Marinicellulosiphila megalodicopiae TaxID=2724896 RepID=UPI003BAEABEA
MPKFKIINLTIFATTIVCSGLSLARDTINIVGSSTVYPFATTVAERFGKTSEFSTPTVESTGTGGGLQLFCQGVGSDYPDIANASRRIKKSEIGLCKKNGIDDIIEVLVGYDGIALANSNKAERFRLTTRDIFLALARQVPGKRPGKLIDNPYQTWKDVNPSLPNIKIRVLGPPVTSGTRDAFNEIALEDGCKSFDWLDKLKYKSTEQYRAVCHSIREDGAFIESGENDNLIVQKLVADPEALGIFGYSFLDQNRDLVQASSINGQYPSFETIASGEYSISRSLYFYVKKKHVDVIPGLRQFMTEFVSEKSIGDDGYLLDKGIISLSEDEKATARSNVKNLTPISF